MSIYHINKSIFLLIILLIFNSCSTKKVYEKIKIKKYELPIIDSFDVNDLDLDTQISNEINLNNKLLLKKFNNNNQYLNNVIVENDKIFSFNNNKLLNFNYKTGELTNIKEIKYLDNEKDILVSFKYLKNSFILAFKSGDIIKIDINGKLIWKYKGDKILNTPIKILKEQIILLYVDEIKSISIEDGSVIWSETYQDSPFYQAKGGQLVNFLNILFFILPNNQIGAIDFDLGSIHSSKFDEIKLISSINNTKDKINIYENYLIYLDEGKYLYTFDIFSNDFILSKYNINSSSSKILFNNAIISKEGNYLQAVNTMNGKTFWLINDKKISKNALIIAVRNHKTNLEIFLNNGDILIISNKELVEIKDMDVGKIKKISFSKQKTIVYTERGKTIIF